jgi:hypothetical protein
MASATEHVSADGAKSAQTSAAKIAAGGTHPPRRLQTFAKLVALSPCQARRPRPLPSVYCDVALIFL